MNVYVFIEFISYRWDVNATQVLYLFHWKIELYELSLFEFVEIKVMMEDTLFAYN